MRTTKSTKSLRSLFLGFLIFLVALIGAAFFFSVRLAERSSRLNQETVLKLKQPITPDEEKKILNLTTPLLGVPSKVSKPRVVILGMDGLDHQYLDPLLHEGKLPHFKKLIEEGAKGTLLSIIPPSSAGAWPAMVTGCGPGKSHLLNFRAYDPSSKKIILTDGRDLYSPALWDILGLYGKKSVVINEAMSYPPHKIQGVMISGLLAPEGKIYTYPETLSAVLDGIGYKREAVPKGEGFFAPQSNSLNDLLLTEQKRLDLSLLLMDKTDWDLFFCMFPTFDRMMHHMGEAFTLKDLEKDILEMDHILGAFIEHLPEGAALLVVSDHGFTFYPKQFSIPRWLEQGGYWALPQKKEEKDASLLRTMQFLKKLEERIHIPDIPGIHWPYALQKDDIEPPIDWEKSSAMTVETGGNWGSIRILKNKETLENEIAGKLALLTDPTTGERIIRRIMAGKELFIGPYQNEMPDLVFEFSKIRADFAFHDEILRKEPTYNHRQEGVVFGWGRAIQKNVLLNPSQIVDITPTVLYLLDVPVSEELDGKIILSFFEPSWVSLTPAKSIPRYPKKDVEWVGVSTPRGESSLDVKENLRSLGYLQ